MIRRFTEKCKPTMAPKKLLRLELIGSNSTKSTLNLKDTPFQRKLLTQIRLYVILRAHRREFGYILFLDTHSSFSSPLKYAVISDLSNMQACTAKKTRSVTAASFSPTPPFVCGLMSGFCADDALFLEFRIVLRCGLLSQQPLLLCNTRRLSMGQEMRGNIFINSPTMLPTLAWLAWRRRHPQTFSSRVGMLRGGHSFWQLRIECIDSQV